MKNKTSILFKNSFQKMYSLHSEYKNFHYADSQKNTIQLTSN